DRRRRYWPTTRCARRPRARGAAARRAAARSGWNKPTAPRPARRPRSEVSSAERLKSHAYAVAERRVARARLVERDAICRARLLRLAALIPAPCLPAGKGQRRGDDGRDHQVAVLVPPRLEFRDLFLLFEIERHQCALELEDSASMPFTLFTTCASGTSDSTWVLKSFTLTALRPKSSTPAVMAMRKPLRLAYSNCLPILARSR